MVITGNPWVQRVSECVRDCMSVQRGRQEYECPRGIEGVKERYEGVYEDQQALVEIKL